MNKLTRNRARTDGWSSALTGVNTTRDKRQSYGYSAISLSLQLLEDLWRGNDVASIIIEAIPEDMMREGYRVSIGEDKEAEKRMCQKRDGLGIDDHLQLVLCYQRAFGGGGLLLGIDDGSTDLTTPLNEDNIKRFDWVTPLSRKELSAYSYYEDPFEAKYGEPKLWQVTTNTGQTFNKGSFVHESRLLLFPGTRVSRVQVMEQNGWGDSVLVRVNDVLRDYQTTWDNAAIILSEFAQGVLKLDGLAELIARDVEDGKGVLKDRIEGMSLAMGSLRMLVLDKEEDYTRQMTPLTGMPEMLDKFTTRVAAAARMPVTRLFGQSPAGMNATGASDLRNWYDSVASMQEKKLRGPLTRFLTLVFLAQNGPTFGKVPESWELEFNPLWQPTEAELADIRLKQSTVDNVEIMQGVVSPEEVAASRHGGENWSWRTTIDKEERAKSGPPTPPPQAGGFGG